MNNLSAVAVATKHETPEMELARLRAENEALRSQPKTFGRLAFKVGEKGGVSVIGLGRFPTTLYKEQWARLIEAVPQLVEFIAANEAILTVKKR